MIPWRSQRYWGSPAVRLGGGRCHGGGRSQGILRPIRARQQRDSVDGGAFATVLFKPTGHGRVMAMFVPCTRPCTCCSYTHWCSYENQQNHYVTRILTMHIWFWLRNYVLGVCRYWCAWTEMYRPFKAYIYIMYKVPLREEARGVAQERNEKHPAWNEYHYAGNRRIKIVFGYLVRTNTLINKRTLRFRTGRYFFFLRILGDKLFGVT